MEEIKKNLLNEIPWCMLFINNIILIGDSSKKVNDRPEECKEAF